VTVHTDAVDDVKVGNNPELADAKEATEKSASPKVFVPPEYVKETVWDALAIVTSWDTSGAA
jgi:hypothetical protein